MGQKQTITHFNFAGGINTESNFLNTPPNDVVEADNCVIEQSGAVRRRTAIDYLGADPDDNVSVSDDVFYHQNAGTANTYRQYDPVPDCDVFTIQFENQVYRFLIAQFGTKIHIYDYDVLSNILDITSPKQEITLPDEAAFYRTNFIQDGQRILILNAALSDIAYLNFNGASFSYNTVEAFVRVYENESPPQIDLVVENGTKGTPNPQNERIIYKAIKPHQSTLATEPGVGDDWEDYWVVWSQWQRGLTNDDVKDWAANFDVTSNVTEVVDPHFTGWFTGCFATGRLFVAKKTEPNKIYFSQVIGDDVKKYGRFYTFADPLSGIPLNDPDIVFTDGGDIVLTQANNILRIVEYNNGVMVFADNGVWFLHGPDGFSPVDYVVQKVTEHECMSADGIVEMEGNLAYCGIDGVYVLSADDTFAQVAPNLLTAKIKKKYTAVPFENREKMMLQYNREQKRLFLLYNANDAEWVSANSKRGGATHFRDILVYDVVLQAWYEYSLGVDAAGTEISIGTLAVVPIGDFGANERIIIDTLDEVIDLWSHEIVTPEEETKLLTSGNLVMLMKPNTTTNKYEIGFGALDQDGFTDFATSPDATDYSIFDTTVTTGLQIYEDILRLKNWPYSIFVFDRTETGVVDATGTDENEGACLLETIIDTVSSGPKVIGPVGIYRPDLFDRTKVGGGLVDGYRTVNYKYKMRGRGRGYQFRFTNDGAKDFDLLGYQILLDVTPRV